MKQRLTALLLMFALLLTMTGCSAAGAAQALDRAEDKIEHKLDAAEDKVEDAVRKAVTPAPAATPSVPVAAPTEPAPASTQSSQPLTKEDALRIALDYLGVAEDQVQRVRTEYEIDDGIPQFDVEFHEGDWEYEFEISAEDGRILSYDKDHKYD